jgi:hypothetical protein
MAFANKGANLLGMAVTCISLYMGHTANWNDENTMSFV